jgi:hypothetical protein
LVEHNCINLRLPTHGGLYAREFEKGSRELKVRVEGQLFFNTTTQMLHAALAGLGLTLSAGGLGATAHQQRPPAASPDPIAASTRSA